MEIGRISRRRPPRLAGAATACTVRCADVVSVAERAGCLGAGRGRQDCSITYYGPFLLFPEVDSINVVFPYLIPTRRAIMSLLVNRRPRERTAKRRRGPSGGGRRRPALRRDGSTVTINYCYYCCFYYYYYYYYHYHHYYYYQLLLRLLVVLLLL